MKYSKQPSLSTDTRLSRSGIFNNSTLNTSSVPIESSNNFYMSNNIHNCENKEIQFLRIKNAQLQEKNKRLTAQIRELQTNKNQILAINSKYVDVVNRYYQGQNKKVQKDKSSTGFRSTKDVFNLSISSTQAHRVLQQLQKDHRNLVKHCLAMQEQIKNYTNEMQKFQVMKSQLRSVNHASVKELIEQIQDLTQQNKNLRKNNNQITYQLQKSKQECKKFKRVHSARQKEAGDSSNELAKLRSLINTTQQQSMDKANAYEARIYQLELKVQRLEKQLREGQQQVLKTNNLHKNLQLKQVQQVHEYQNLQKSLTDLLRSRQRANSMYTKVRNPSKNLTDISVNNAIHRGSFSRNPKNQRRSIATQKTHIIL